MIEKKLLHNTPENINKLFSDPKYISDYLCKERLAWYGEMIRLFVDEANVDFKHRKIADIGCGTGHALKYIHDNYSHGLLYGYDYSSKVLEIAKEILPYTYFLLHDLSEPLYNDFDIIIGLKDPKARITPNIQAFFLVGQTRLRHKGGLPLKIIANGARDITQGTASAIINLQNRKTVTEWNLV